MRADVTPALDLPGIGLAPVLPVILWLNGPFGIGKTTTARALRRLAPQRGRRASIYDPELLGSLLQRTLPRRLRPADFRDQRVWRWTTRVALSSVGGGPRTWIVPMCIDDPDMLAELLGSTPAVVFQLTAPAATVADRIRGRGHGTAWALDHLDRWQPRPTLGTPVPTQNRTPSDVAAEIAQAIWGSDRGTP